MGQATGEAGGSFSTTATGPWSPTLTVAITSGTSALSVYYRDTEPGSPTITASAAGKVAAAQVATIAADSTPPETTMVSAPSGSIASTAAAISFSSEPDARFECSLDGAAFAECASPASYSGLAQGTHAFDVRAIDAAGNVDASPAQARWTVDTTAPDTRITQVSRPDSRSATFWFTASEAASFACSLDGGAWVSCISPKSYTGLYKGWHTVRVRATDAAGNVDATPASYSFKI